MNQLFRGRKELCKQSETSIAPFLASVEIGPSVPPRDVAEAPLTTSPALRQVIIETDLGSGHRIQVDATLIETYRLRDRCDGELAMA
ncbi:hypothetical protein ABIB90_007884 [Bradyrhizobium sp. JR4.1]|uniref:hypothetical protein n=1 Tax=Bradyrhizobium sp. JR4.1 TaxID=3156372 RepID=UPI003398D50E